MNIRILSSGQLSKRCSEGISDNTAVISFYGLGQRKVDLSGVSSHIQKQIEDLNTNDIPEFEHWHTDDFKEIGDFISDCYHKGMNFICSCDRGHCRSAACAMAILEYYGRSGMKIYDGMRVSFKEMRVYYS